MKRSTIISKLAQLFKKRHNTSNKWHNYPHSQVLRRKINGLIP
jgi:hypothetical protein